MTKTPEEWRNSLKTPGLWLAAYLIVPPLLNFALGPLDYIWGRPFVSYAVQAGLGLGVLRGLLALKAPLWAELGAWLGRLGQPPERTFALTGSIVLTSGRLAAVALLLSPLTHLLPRWLGVPATLLAVAYVAYAAHGLWKVYEPFVAKTPEAPEPKAVPEAPEAPERRCGRCGQKLAENDEYCGFCHQPVDRQPGVKS